MTPEDLSEAISPVADAMAELRGLGHDADDIGRLFLNGAAVVLHSGCTETEFLELARQMWRAKERQVSLAGLLDRVESSSEFRVRFGKQGRRRPSRPLESVKGEAP